MDKEIIKKEISIKDNNTIEVVEETKSILTKYQLEKQLSGIKDRKFRLQEQNKQIVAEFKELEEEEIRIENLIKQLAEVENGIEEL